MGRLHAEELASMLDGGELSLEDSVRLHLQSNHYPPIPASMIKPCIAAIDAANSENFDLEIEMPEDVSYLDGNTAPAWSIVETFHLDSWIELEEI